MLGGCAGNGSEAGRFGRLVVVCWTLESLSGLSGKLYPTSVSSTYHSVYSVSPKLAECYSWSTGVVPRYRQECSIPGRTLQSEGIEPSPASANRPWQQ
jgi:hypothetical protein